MAKKTMKTVTTPTKKDVKKPRTKEDLAEIVGQVCCCTTKTSARQILDDLVKMLQDEIIKFGALRLQGIGIFKVQTRASRKGHNPRTGEEIVLASKKVVKFSLSKDLSDLLNV